MKAVFRVKTPIGRAENTEKQIKHFIIGFNKVKINTYTNEQNNEIIWEVEGDVKRIMNINRNLARFDSVMKSVFEHKYMQKYGMTKLNKEEQEQLKDMLQNQTSVEVIKMEEQMQETDGLSFWEKVKSKFRFRKVQD